MFVALLLIVLMAKEGPNWDGLLKWSLAHSDGTNPSRNLRYPSCSFKIFVNLEFKISLGLYVLETMGKSKGGNFRL